MILTFPLLPAPSIAYKRLGLEVSGLCLVVSGRCLRVSGVEPIKDILEKILGHDTQIYPFLLVKRRMSWCVWMVSAGVRMVSGWCLRLSENV